VLFLQEHQELVEMPIQNTVKKRKRSSAIKYVQVLAITEQSFPATILFTKVLFDLEK